MLDPATHLDDVCRLGDHDGEGTGRHAGHYACRDVDVVLAGTCQMTSPVTGRWSRGGTKVEGRQCPCGRVRGKLETCQ